MSVCLCVYIYVPLCMSGCVHGSVSSSYSHLNEAEGRAAPERSAASAHCPPHSVIVCTCVCIFVCL